MTPATAVSDLEITIKSSLSASELDDVAALVSEAHWNQVAADWRLFLELGRVYAAHSAGRIVATTATLPYGGRFAWISMVLVAGSYRRRGLATRLMRRAMDDLAAARLTPVLDATPEGRRVYRALGFQDSWEFHRLIRREQHGEGASFPSPAGVSIRPITDGDWAELCAFDAAAFGAQRSGVLTRMRGRLSPAELIAESAGRIVGFTLGRDGRLAGQVGPLIADNEAIACALIARALKTIDGPVFVDLADAKPEIRSFLETRGFLAVRPFTRMLFGRSTRFDDATRTFAVLGPEFG